LQQHGKWLFFNRSFSTSAHPCCQRFAAEEAANVILSRHITPAHKRKPCLMVYSSGFFQLGLFFHEPIT